MGLSGHHPPITRWMARAILPPGACRDCVWTARYLPFGDYDHPQPCILEHDALRELPGPVRFVYACGSCGITFDPRALVAEMRRRGWIEPAAPQPDRPVKVATVTIPHGATAQERQEQIGDLLRRYAEGG